METGEKVKLNPVQIKEKYQESVSEFSKKAKTALWSFFNRLCSGGRQ